ncbi:MAG: tRNA (adenosine(37)-N6)-threonylcarbamoyltransferase complex dimerization subunit type 1 TsaB [Caldimicrobium sp.]
METSIKPPLIFSLSSSGKIGGIALFQERLLLEINFLARESYASGIFKGLSFIKENFKEFLSQIDYIAVDVGPGSFTGLRIGLSVIKAFDLFREIPFIPVSSLEILAWNYPCCPYPILTIIDAYSKELFIALYKWEGEFFKNIIPPSLIPFEKLSKIIDSPTLFVSETLEKWEEEFKRSFGEKFLKPSFSPVLRAGLLSQIASIKLRKGMVEFVKGEELLPLYLKPSEAERKRCYFIS